MTFLMKVEFPTRFVRQSAIIYTPGIQHTGAFIVCAEEAITDTSICALRHKPAAPLRLVEKIIRSSSICDHEAFFVGLLADNHH